MGITSRFATLQIVDFKQKMLIYYMENGKTFDTSIKVKQFSIRATFALNLGIRLPGKWEFDVNGPGSN